MKKKYTKLAISCFLVQLITINVYAQDLWGVGTTNDVANAQFQNGFIESTTNANFSVTDWTALSISHRYGNVTPGAAFWERSTLGYSQGGYATSTTPVPSPSQSDGVAIFDSDFMDNNGTTVRRSGIAPGSQKGELISPRIDLTGNTDEVLAIKFYNDLRVAWITGYSVSFSTDDGVTWGEAQLFGYTVLDSFYPPQGFVNISFPDSTTQGVTDLSQCRFKFTLDMNNYYVIIDDITIMVDPLSFTYVPDDNFENYLETHNASGGVVPFGDPSSMGNGIANDDIVRKAKIETVTSLTIDNLNIADLTGIEDFSALTNLNCNSNQLTSLDVTQNTNLMVLNAEDNLINSYVDTSQNLALTNLSISSNLITNLDLSSNTNLIELKCQNNQLESLTVKNSNNVNITTLNATINPNLICIEVDDKVYATNNWTGVNFAFDPASNFREDCSLYYTYIPDDNFEDYLETHDANGNGVALGDPTSMGNGIANDDTVITYNIEDVTSLTIVNLNIADLTGIANFTALTSLICNQNQITSLDVSQNTSLIVLNAEDNLINGYVNTSQNLALTNLIIGNNSINALYLALNTNLVELECQNNQLEALFVKNGNNANFTAFNATVNPNLLCIEVDDEVYANTNWTNKDPNSSFSNTCITEVPKLPLVEHFTNASCGPCDSQNPIFKARLDAFGTENYVRVSYATDFPGFDPMNQAFPYAYIVRKELYGANSIPSAYINGKIDPINGSLNTHVTQAKLAAAAALTTPYLITATQTWNSSTSITVNIDIKNTSSSAISLADKLYVLMLENHIEYSAPPGGNNEKTFDYDVRQMYNPVTGGGSTNGIALGAIPAFTTQNYNFTVTDLPNYIRDYNELSFAVFIQNNSTRVVHQAAKTQASTVPGLIYADIIPASTVESGYCGSSFTPSVILTNNGSVDISSAVVAYEINGGTPVSQTFNGTVTQGQSNPVTFPEINLNSGQSIVNYSMLSINGGTVYNSNYLFELSEEYDKLPDIPAESNMSQGMETAVFAGSGYSRTIENAIFDSATPVNINNFSIYNGVGNGLSTKSLLFRFYALNSATPNMDFILQKTNLGGNAELTFNYTYRQYATENDKLEILVSTDCGVTWSPPVFSKAGVDLATVGASNNQYLGPLASDWRLETIDLSAYNNTNDVVICFRATAAFGNNLFIDDINISSDALETSVPDDNFENYLETHNASGGGVTLGDPSSMGNGIANDDLVITAKIETVTNLTIVNLNIADLTGIEDFSALTTLNCNSNQLTSLDVSSITTLTSLDCSINPLEILNVQNGINSQFTFFSSLNNPNLYCVLVDDSDYANTNWTNKDPQTEFNGIVCHNQNIEFTFENAQRTNDGSDDFYEVDVMVATVGNQEDFILGSGEVYINYNPLAFGNSINIAGGLEITSPAEYMLGEVNGFTPYYTILAINDDTTSRFSFAYQQFLSSGAMPEAAITSTPAKLFHIKMKVTNAGQLPIITFEDNETEPLGVSNCRDQFYTACGPSALALVDCTNFPGVQFQDAYFDSSGAALSTTTTTTWTGATDNDWATASNWSDNTVPTSTYYVSIPSGTPHDPIVSPATGAEASVVTVNAGATLTLESTSTQFSSLIADTATGDIFYKRYTAQVGPIGTNDFISPPLSGQQFNDFEAANTGVLALNPANTIAAFAPFNTTTNAYENYATSATTPLAAGKGYRAATLLGSPLTFTGTVNTGTVNTSITEDTSSWNLIGNPYPSYIDFETFFPANEGQFDLGIYKAIFGYDGNASDGWIVWNQGKIDDNINYPQLLITPGQGFFVRAKVGAGTVLNDTQVAFTPEMRTSGTTDDFIFNRNTNVDVALAKLQLSKGLDTFTTDIYFNSNTTKNLDPGYDAGSFQGNASGIYTELVEGNTGVELAIQALAYTDFSDVVVPLGIKANAGEQISISLDDATTTLPEYIYVYLEDNANNTWMLLNDGDYTITPSTNLSETGRFFLHFQAEALSTSDIENSGLQVFVNQDHKTLVVNGLLHDTTEVAVYDILGRVVLSTQLESNSTVNLVDVASINAGAYVVSISNSAQHKTLKIIIK